MFFVKSYILVILIILFVSLLCYFLITYNRLIKLDNKVKESFATMDVYLKKRWDLIPNIVETVKGYSEYERDTLKEVISLRNTNYDNLSLEEKIKTNEQINTSISRLMAIKENYPDLLANKNFLELQNRLSEIEDEIANSRKYYNAVVRIYNNSVEMFPSNIVAKIMNYKTKEMFMVSINERKNVLVDL